MYVPPHFVEARAEVLHHLIEKNPLGTLFTNGKSGFDANHIPFELHAHEGQQGVLHSHVAGTSPICQDLATGDEVLIDFRAADAYIAPNWYPSKVESKKQVPS
ncbi:FMN-binding negative transcriptional regulator [Bradyrhizobium sp. 131]|nr:FMN-binding negative transcriptional regulator [Bradyrhizobium sp. 131]